MKISEKEKASALRRKGLTYKEIAEELPISKSTLSSWLQHVKLTDKQIERIHGKNIEIRNRFVVYNAIKKAKSDERKASIFLSAQNEIAHVSGRELKLVGCALYWGEGSKSLKPGIVIFANSDPAMILVIMRWFREICKVPESKFRLKVQTYDNEKVKQDQLFWSTLTGIPLGQFIKPYIKQSKYSNLRRGNTLPYGTLHIRVADINLLTRILGWISGFKALSSS